MILHLSFTLRVPWCVGFAGAGHEGLTLVNTRCPTVPSAAVFQPLSLCLPSRHLRVSPSLSSSFPHLSWHPGLSVCLFISQLLSVSVSFSLLVSVSPCLSLSVSVSLGLSVPISPPPSPSLSPCVSIPPYHPLPCAVTLGGAWSPLPVLARCGLWASPSCPGRRGRAWAHLGTVRGGSSQADDAALESLAPAQLGSAFTKP